MISLGELPAPFAVLTPTVEEALPLCVLLLGAGGTRDSLADLQPLFEEWWAEGAVPRMVVATLRDMFPIPRRSAFQSSEHKEPDPPCCLIFSRIVSTGSGSFATVYKIVYAKNSLVSQNGLK